MSQSPDFRNWAARVVRQATKERDAGEAMRLMSIAGYCERLADIEDWERDGLQPPKPKHTGGLPRIGEGLSRMRAQVRAFGFAGGRRIFA
jgi:hypothetical protein